MSRSQPPEQQPRTYNHEQYHALIMAADRAIFAQLVTAANLVSEMLQANSIPYALMGGFALRLRGSARDTHDVDVAVGCTMQRLIEVLSDQSKIRRPAGPTSGVMRIFVLVDEQMNPSISELWVAVDIIISGSLGAPDQPQASSEVVSYDTDAGQKQFLILDLLNAMSSKLDAYYSRQNPNDYEDIIFLIDKYTERIFAIRTQLSTTNRQYFVTSFAQINPENATRRVKHILGVA